MRSCCQFDELLMARAVIELAQHGDNLGTTELRRNFLAIGEHFAQSRTRNREPVVLFVRAGFACRHAAALIAIKRNVDLQRLREHAARWQRVENVMRVVRPVVVADSCVITADHKV